MIVEQLLYTSQQEKAYLQKADIGDKAQLVLVFGAKHMICSNVIFDELRSLYPRAYILGCSTAGEIIESRGADKSLTATAVYFEKTTLRFASMEITGNQDYYLIAEKLSQMLPPQQLKHIFLISEGVNVNGSKLVSGLRDSFPPGVTLTGGLSGDGPNFKETYVIANGYARKNIIVMAAFYGENMRIGFGSVGGWGTFGIERAVTRSDDNILYELDGKPVLDLYKEYLGEYSANLPYSALLFPLSIRSRDGRQRVRTILGVDEAAKSLVFAGDMPEGEYARLMKASATSLINGALTAAKNCVEAGGCESPKLAILISCVGRKLVLKQMIDDEVEVTREVLGENTVYTGFYSYGEICPVDKDSTCDFHNQTMTITTLDEE